MAKEEFYIAAGIAFAGAALWYAPALIYKGLDHLNAPKNIPVYEATCFFDSTRKEATVKTINRPPVVFIRASNLKKSKTLKNVWQSRRITAYGYQRNNLFTINTQKKTCTYDTGIKEKTFTLKK